MNALSSDEQARKMGVPLRVLIVIESNVAFLFLVHELCEGGYDPVCERVETAEAMSAALDREAWDAILIDYSLSGFSGVAALELIKRKHIDLPTIVVSGKINDEMAVAAMKAGAHDYIMKNNLTRLVPAIEREIREAKGRQECRFIEKALQETEKKFFAFFQHSPLPMAITSVEEGRLFDVNEQYTRLTEFSREELIGHTSIELNLWVDPEERKRYVQSIERNHGKIKSHPVSVRTKSGNVIKALFSANIIKINDASYLLSSAVDIAERVKTEDILKTQAHILDRMAEGVNLADENGFITFTNPAYDAIFGYERNELIGQHVSILNTGSSADNIRRSNEIIQELKTTGIWSGEFANRKKDGTPLTTHAHISAMEVSGKQFWVTVQEDITARRKSEIRMARLNDCFLQFGASPADNINRLVAICGEMMNATWALYNRLKKNLLCSVGQWRTPADFTSEDKPDGHICYDVIQQAGGHPLLVRNLQESPYARTDPTILSHGLQTYIGLAVKWKQAAAGSLCVVYQNDIIPSSDDLQFMTIIASAIAIEENRQRAEEALNAAEENFRRSLDDSPLGVRIATAEGKTLYVNRMILDIFGYDSIEELRRIPLRELYTPESHAAAQTRTKKRKQGDTVPAQYEVSIVRKDGEIRVLQVFRKLTLWDGEQQFQVLYQDITERKRAGEALAKSEALYRSLATTADLMYLVDSEGRYLFLNDEYMKRLGLSKEQVIGRFYGDFYSEEATRAFMDSVKKVFDTENVYQREHASTRDGKTFLITYSPVKDHQGHTRAVTIAAKDITKRKQAEEALRRSQEQLRAFAGRLQAVREEERTQIAREIHDEMGGALTAMKIDLSLLEKEAAKARDKALRESQKARMDEMTKLIDATMQTVRRIATGLRPGILDDLGLRAAIEWQVTEFQKRTGIRCEFSSSGEFVELDVFRATTLFRIAQEALTNVARHARATEVHIRMEGTTSAILLEMKDNGVGIKEEEIQSPKALGILGMQERALSFGGRVTITGRPGEGTTVTVESPPAEKRKQDREAGG